jgi:hypothetical protein
MTSRCLQNKLEKVNGENGHAHVVVWVNGAEYEVVDVERDEKRVRVIASSPTPPPG